MVMHALASMSQVLWVLLPLPTTHRCLATAGLVCDGPMPSKADLSFAVRELWEQQVIFRVPLALLFPSESQEQPRTVSGSSRQH